MTKTILITGATGGIGRDAALTLARLGHHVIATGRRVAALEALEADAAGATVGGGKLDTVRLDVTAPDSIAEAVTQVERLTDGTGLDGLVNNAGYGQPAPMEELSDQDLRAQFETNVFGLHNVTRALLPLLRKKPGARIVNVSSVAGRTTFPLFGAYHASKYAVEALSDALRMEMRPFGMRVVLIEPGPIATNFAQTSHDRAGDYMDDRRESRYQPVYEMADKIKTQSDKMAAPVGVVTRVILKGLLARRPRARYVVPLSSRVLLWILSRMPTFLRDALLCRVLGFTQKKLVAAPPARKELESA